MSHAAILWVKPSETPPSCGQSSHAAVLWVNSQKSGIAAIL